MNIPMRLEDYMMEVVCDLYNVTEDMLSQRSRKPEFVIPRHLYIYGMVSLSDTSDYTRIAGRVKRDRSNVYHAIKTIDNILYTKDSNYPLIRKFCDMTNCLNDLSVPEFLRVNYPYVNHTELKHKCFLIMETNGNYSSLVVTVGYNNIDHNIQERKFYDRLLNYGNKVWFAKTNKEASKVINEYLNYGYQKGL